MLETSAEITVKLGKDAYEILTKLAEVNCRNRKQQMRILVLEAGQREGIFSQQQQPQTKRQKEQLMEVSAKS